MLTARRRARGALAALVTLAASAPIGAAHGCFAPEAPIGAPCSLELECPTGQFCDPNASGGPTCLEAPRGGDVVDVSAGGSFAFDARGAADELQAPCAGAAGPEVRFRITLALPEVIYADTFGSSGAPAIAIYPGRCTNDAAIEPIACAARTCGALAQGAWSLGAGEHCLVVDHAGVPDGPGRLSVLRTGRAGDPLADATGTVTGNTCDDDDSNDAPCGCGPDRDHHYFFTVCPEARVTARLETCGGAAWDTVLQLRDADDRGLGCNDDNEGACGAASTASRLTRDVTGPGLFWAIIDGCDDCGPYELAYSLTPNP